MKKILIFSIAYFPHIGGAEVAIKEITDRLRVFEYDMITLNFGNDLGQEKIGNINIYRVGGAKFLFPIRAYLKAKELNKEKKYDLIWSIMAAYAGFASLFFKMKFNTPFLLTLQEGDSEKHILKRVGILYLLWKKIFKKADCIQVISNYLSDFAKKYGANCPIEVIPNGVDLNKFKSKIENLKINDEIILITTSRLVKKNAVGDIIEALKYLPENVKLIIIGDGTEKEKLSALSSRLSVQERISFLGYLEHEEMIGHLQNADIFIRPSLSEGLGNSFLEAMAVGIPVIATSVGGIPDFLTNEVTGLFCEVNNPKSIADKVEMYLENDELRKKIVSNAQNMVTQKYDWNLISQKMENLFNKII